MKKEELLKFYDKFKLLIFPAVIALSSLILIILVIYPQVIKLLDNQKKTADLGGKANFLEAKALELENYNTEDLQVKVKSALSSYPADKDYANLVKLLQNIVAQSGFNVVALSLGAASDKKGNAQSYSIKLDVLGAAAKLPILLGQLESSYRLMRLSTLETSGGKDGQTSVSLNIEVLYASAPDGFGNIESPLPKLSQKEEEILSRLTAVNPIVSQEPAASQLGPKGKSNPFE